VLSELCSVCVETLSVTGAGITLMGSDDMPASMGASDPSVERLEELEFTLGQGPWGDAYRQGAPIFETDLLWHPPAAWPAFASCAVDAGLHAVFSFPLQIGVARLGVLALYQERPGALGDDTAADAFVMADVITRTILDMHAGVPEESLMNMVSEEGAYRAEVHQASGMISVQLHVGVGEALALLRARAFALDRRIGDVAADVVSRRLRFDE
jgi:GAF domain